ncbi:MAG: tetratricopeptide repeat protein [Aristaeellaceae bacterium]
MRENHGKLVPFAPQASRMRRVADTCRRQGRMEDALVLLRRAAEQEDTVAGWLPVARQLRQMGCYEQASELLYRLCAREDMLPEVWLELGRCQQALRQQEAACDSLYHYLQEDPYSPEAEEAHILLDSMEQPEQRHGQRQEMLVQRGMRAFRHGQQELGQRRIRRALRMTQERVPLHIALALLALSNRRPGDAIRELNRALRLEPENAHAMSVLCVTLHGMGRRRMALGLLQRCAAMATEPAWEEYFLMAAWTLSAWGVARQYLETRRQKWPCRILLMHPLAELAWQAGDREQALQGWHQILLLDPSDQRAHLMLDWVKSCPDEPLPARGELPEAMMTQRMTGVLLKLLNKPAMDTVLAWDSPMRMTMDWGMCVPNPGLQAMLVGIVGSQDEPCVRRWLRERLTLPGTLPDIRQQVLVRLADMGDTSPMNVLIGQRMTTAQLTKEKHVPGRQWKQFLLQLLQETRRTCEGTELAFFACDLWQVMTPMQRQEAVGHRGYQWVKAMEILYLRLTGRDEEAARIVRGLPVSARKISRVMRSLKHQTDQTLQGEDHHEEVH